MRTKLFTILLVLVSLLAPTSLQSAWPVTHATHASVALAPVTAAPFVPRFITPTIKSDFGGVWTWVNSDWFLDNISSQFMATKYHALGIEQRAVFGTQGPYHVVNPPGLKQNWLIFLSAGGKGDTTSIPAGFLASYYLRWDQATAETLIWKNLKDSGVLTALQSGGRNAKK